MRRPSPHWLDADHIAESLSIIEPANVTVRQFVEQFDGCSGAAAGRIAAPFGKNRSCRDLADTEFAELLKAAQSAARKIKPEALGAVGREALDPETFDGYGRASGEFQYGAHRPCAMIPFLVEAWASVTSKKGGEAKLTVFVNRSVIVGEVSAVRQFSRKEMYLSGCGLYCWVEVPGGDCDVVLHITTPLMPIPSNGKQPFLDVFTNQIEEAVRRAFTQSRNRLPQEPGAPKPPAGPKPVHVPRPPVEVFVPRGCLGRRIIREANSIRVSLDDLTVLTPNLDPYRFDHAVGNRDGQWFADQVQKYVVDGAVVHLRGLFYRLVAAGDVRRPGSGEAFVNTEGNWRWLCEKAAKAARWLDLVAFERIRDERNEAPIYYGTDDKPTDVIAGSGTCFQVQVDGDLAAVPDLAELLPVLAMPPVLHPRQPFRICMIGEKSSLAEVLRPIAQEIGAGLLLSSGDPSETHIAELVASAAADGRPLVVLYFSDFDPSGWNMPTAVARKLQAHRDLRFPDLAVQLHRVALTLEQVREYGLPRTPLKDTERRAARWREAMGHEQTEIDALAALRPETLEAIVRDAIRPFYDETLKPRHDAANMMPPAAQDWFEVLSEYADAVTAITDKHEHAVKAIDRLNDKAEAQVELLPAAVLGAADAPVPPDTIVEPKITAVAPAPLFTSKDGFGTACIKLKASKRLESEDDAPVE